MRYGIRLFAVAFAVAFSAIFSTHEGFARDTLRPKNVILFIGDGMGLSHIYAAYTMNKGHLNMMDCPFTGFSLTHSASSYTTDSGAGATAISCGKKTYNGAIGMDADSIPCRNIIEYAEEKGMSTGMIVTSAITHATPAAFIAHQQNRSQYEAIAADFLRTDIDLIIGGGADHFSKRSDGADLISRLKNNGYEVFMYPSSIGPFHGPKVAVFTDSLHNTRFSEGRGNMLPEATEQAISLLSKNEKGFFLMVEGSQIDWGSHNNNIGYVVEELIDMDNAVGKAIDFARRSGNTLVIVTADHETGGLAVTNGDMNDGTVITKFSTMAHTGIMVPVFAYGAGAEKFTGVYENTAIFSKLTNLLNLTNPCIPVTP